MAEIFHVTKYFRAEGKRGNQQVRFITITKKKRWIESKKINLQEVDEFVSSARRVVFNKETVFFFQWNLFRINELVKMITRITMEDADVLKHKLFVTIPCSQTHKKWILKTFFQKSSPCYSPKIVSPATFISSLKHLKNN